MVSKKLRSGVLLAVAMGWVVAACSDRSTGEVEPADNQTEEQRLCDSVCTTYQRCGEETGQHGDPYSECVASCMRRYFAEEISVCRDLSVAVAKCEAARDCSKWPSTEETGTPCAEEKEPWGLCRSNPALYESDG